MSMDRKDGENDLNLMKNMKKRSGKGPGIVLAVLLLAAAAVLSGCGAGAAGMTGENGSQSPGAAGETGSGERLRVVTTLFPYYDFTRQIAGELVDLSVVIPAGMDSHSFEPTPADIRKIQQADVVIANGGEMEQWLSQVLDSLNQDSLTVVYMMDYVDVVEEEVVEGMEHDHDHGHDHDGHEEAGDHDHEAEVCTEDHDHSLYDEDESLYEIEYDEHIWTSPVNAMKITEIIGETLKRKDPGHAEIYETAKNTYLEELKELDGEFRKIREEAVHDIMVMGDKFPLRYFADEYGLRYRAAFSGCSSDTEPSAKTIAYLIDKIREENLPVVFYLELSSHRVAEIIGEETGAKPLLFHSCHNVTRREFESGVTYLQLMEQNVKNLREGLCQ